MATSTSKTPASDGEPPHDELGAEADRRGPMTVVAATLALEWVVVLAGAVLVALVIKTFVVQAFYIPSESMVPTLLANDRVLVNKVTYRTRDVDRGDVVVFERPEARRDHEIKDLIKRVVGLPGEEIHFEAGRVHINGQPLDEPYLSPGTSTGPAPSEQAFEGRPCTRIEPCTIPARMIWVLGDNRSNSQDSRYEGPVLVDNVIGRAFVIVWPIYRLGGL
jgi:signal peptidase I